MTQITTSQVSEKVPGEKVSIKGIVYQKKNDTTKTGNFYFWLSIMDKSGTTTFPVFDNAQDRFEKINKGDIIGIEGFISEFNNTKNIKPIGFIIDSEGSHLDYTPSYDTDQGIINEFDGFVESLSSPYKEFAKKAIIGQEDFFLAPAAETGHHNKIGGLFIHTYGVVKNIKNIVGMYKESWRDGDLETVVSPDRLILSAMCHDIEKINEYEFKKGIYRKEDVALDHTKSFCAFADKVNNELKSEGDVFLGDEDLLRLKRLVMSHHGPWGSPHPKNLEETLLHLADMIDSRVEQCIQAGDEKFRINFSTSGMIGAVER